MDPIEVNVTRHEGGPPKWLIASIAIVVLAVMTLGFGGWYIAREDCQALVNQRRSSRSVWVALIEKNPGAEADEFRDEILDVHLPALRCSGTTAIPVN